MLDLDGERGVLTVVDFHACGGGRVAKRQHLSAGLLDSAEFDDGDGKLESRVGYDRFEEPGL